MLDEKRKNRRYPSIARAHIEGDASGDALLKDLSITGCCIEYTVHPDMKIGQRYTVEISPEENSKIGAFSLVTECRWVRPVEYSCDIGFDVMESPKGKTFQRYVDYLAWRNEASK
jgi:hypothetical protein